MMGSVLTDGLFSVRRRAWPAGQIVRTELVMPEFDPGIHVFLSGRSKDVDGQDKPGNDEGESYL
jgi:hypothetical protein